MNYWYYSMYKFLVPGYYLFYSRLKSKLEKISWFIIYIIPVYILGLFYTDYSIGIFTLFFIFSVLIFNSIYEIGYIENDIQTIKKEKKPTLRLEKKDYIFFEENYKKVLFLKIFIAFLLLVIVYILSIYFSLDIYIFRFISMLMIVRLMFYFHNKIRSRINIITFFTLATTKYIMPLFLILSPNNLVIAWMISFLIFPLLRIMEHARKEKYELRKWITFIGNLDLFRIKYYLFMSILTLLIYLSSQNTDIALLHVLLVYFLIYRVASFMLVSKKIYTRK